LPCEIKVNVRPQRNCVYPQVEDKLHVLFEIISGQVIGEERPPVELVVVLDRSGSMKGEKLQFAKIATLKVIKMLKVDSDKFKLVTFASDVIIETGDLIEPAELIKRIKSMCAGGGTNLMDGLEIAFDILKQSKNPLKRIFLFSDGEANVKKGILERIDYFMKHGVTVSSFGIGDSFDEDLMRGIAEKGSGDYFYMQNAISIPDYVSRAISGLKSLIGINGSFKLFPEIGTTITQIYGPENPGDEYLFGDITSSNQRNIIAEIQVKPPKYGQQWKAATWELSYNPIQANQTGTREYRKGEIQFTCTNEINEIVDHDQDVIIAVKIKESGKIDRLCKSLLDSGKVEEAIRIKRDMLNELKEFSSKDTSGKIAILIELGEKALQEVETGEPIASLTKNTNSPSKGQQLIKKPKKLLVTRKYFDSADYYCRNDNIYNWNSSNLDLNKN